MSIRPLLFPFLLFTTVFMRAQSPPGIQWQTSIGGSGFERAWAIEPTSDGGYITAGMTESNDGDVTGHHGSADYWVAKLDATGAIQWQRALGGIGIEWGKDVVEASDGGYIVVGYAETVNGDVQSTHGFCDYWVVKLDMNGGIAWKRSFGGSYDEQPESIAVASDGGYLIVGNTHSDDGDVTMNHGATDLWAVKMDVNGFIQWQRSYGGTNGENAYAAQPMSDGGWMVAGSTYSNDGDVSGQHGSMDAWVLRLDSLGTLLWQRTLGGTDVDVAYGILVCSGGGTLMVGESRSDDGDLTANQGGSDYWVVKLDDGGALEWQRSLGGSQHDWANAVQENALGGYLVVGTVTSVDGNISAPYSPADKWLVALDASGATIWERCVGGSGMDQSHSMRSTSDGGFVLAGGSGSTDGDATANHGDADLWIVKFAGSTEGLMEEHESEWCLFPVPSSGSVSITMEHQHPNALLTLSSAHGQVLLREPLRSPTHTLDLQSLPKGLYHLSLFTQHGVRTERLVLE
ncbi:MAG: T9SS type A sorting domain-containing protein [Flavobacteriales bacterium]|nr:T9SS type A sorting domain-containing protein [Flavobacteriales bacterium]MBP6697704.1 T9SS type A sorting domain-containing protein [Flavobacteriales bacterium]